MRTLRWLGVLLLCYSLVPLVNATVPAAAHLAGQQLTVSHDGSDSYECLSDLGAPPLAGLYGGCDAYARPEGGELRPVTLRGPSEKTFLPPKARDTAWGWGHQAYLWEGTSTALFGVVGILLFLLGVTLVIRGFRRTSEVIKSPA
ncbi:MAG: hypothetical protein HOV77_12210 [Hamadaea sp.]|uniref:hypothetical protein n=1 Tax=Hamadaea sp. TaxID=2024425 RepID=UPI001821AB37|nr:hypothetical protein [Hamadaea sp.]NUT19946.1 hypothetical protein [Hamadaea sp.]